MRKKNTLIMAVVAGVLVAAVYFLEIRGADERADADLVADRLLSFETEDVSGLRIKTADLEVSVTRDDDGWRITEPYDLAADDAAIDRIGSECEQEVLDAREVFRKKAIATPREVFDYMYETLPPELQEQQADYFAKLDRKGVE